MAWAAPQDQISQEELLRILKKVKDSEIGIEEAISLAKEKQNLANRKPPAQHNFTVYKYRYRWQKRILQIDFYSQTIFNIEKGILKKQFPFSQVKSCKDLEGLRFIIQFYGHQDYEIEAASAEDKQKILGIMNEILQSQKNSQASPIMIFAKKNEYSDVIVDGLLELYDEPTDRWVKYLVQVKREELIFYCSQQLEPQKISINLSECSVTAGTQNACATFSISSKARKYIFRIPINEQNKDPEKSIIMRNDWVSLLQKHCGGSEQSSSSQSDTYEVLDFNRNQMQSPLSLQDSPSESKMQNVAELSKDMTSPVLEPFENGDGFPDLKIGIPPYIPPPPLPPPRQNTPKRTKAFHWNVVPPDKIGKSIWAKNFVPKKIDDQRVLHQFQTSEVSSVPESDISKIQNILLDRKIAHNFNIVLKSFHFDPEQLKEKLLIIRECDGGLSDEHLTNLRRYVPTANDIKMYLSYKGPQSELHIVDQFMLQMCKIPDLCPRLDTLLAVRELPGYMKYLQPPLLQKIKACSQLLRSQAFPAVLSYILALGNFLNENAGKEKARGFKLSSLTKMAQLASKEKSFTLMHALVEQILLQEPDLAKFSQELTEFEAVPGASVKGLSAEVDVLSKQLEAIDQYQKSFKVMHHKASASEEQFLKDLKAIVEHYRAQQVELMKKASEMKKLYAEVLQKFGENENQDSQELFGWIGTFIKEFQSAYVDIRPPQT
ncbi:disheveled-associated activator of morphogenesis 1-A-like [Pyxicephalus adspersus]|uniref:disheveled-associated activator of morphogenesis 1-A-like n=1 Tax=Pyxicephalus adspersus TaxID=30357 RepID=UPI003B59BAD1